MKKYIFKIAFTPLEKATDFSRWPSSRKANGGIKPPLAQTVRERSSLTGFTYVLVFLLFLIDVTISFGGVLKSDSAIAGFNEPSAGNAQGQAKEYLLKIKLKPCTKINEIKTRKYAWEDQTSPNNENQCGLWEFDLLSSRSCELPALVLDVTNPFKKISDSDASNDLIIDDLVEIILLNPMDKLVKSRLIFSLRPARAGQELQVNLNGCFVELASCFGEEICIENLELSAGINIVTLFTRKDLVKKEPETVLNRESIRCEVVSLEAIVPLHKTKKTDIYSCRNSQFGGVNVFGRFHCDSRPYFLMSRPVDIKISDYSNFVFSFLDEQSPFDSIKFFLALDCNEDNLIDRYIEIPNKDSCRKMLKDGDEEYLDLQNLLTESSIDKDTCRIKRVLFAAYSNSTDDRKDLILEIRKFNFFASRDEEKTMLLPLGFIDWDDLQFLEDKKFDFFHYVDKNNGFFVSYFGRDSFRQKKEIKYIFAVPGFSTRPELIKVVYNTTNTVNKVLSFYLQIDKDADGQMDGDILIGESQRLKNWKLVRSSENFDEYEISLLKNLDEKGLNFSFYKDGSLIKAVPEAQEKDSEAVILYNNSGVVKLRLPRGRDFEGRYDIIFCDQNKIEQNDSHALSMNLGWLYEIWPNVKFKAVKAVLCGEGFNVENKTKSNWHFFVLEEIGFFVQMPYENNMISIFEKFFKFGKTPLLKIDDEVIEFEGSDDLIEKETFEKGILTKKIKLSSGEHSYQVLENEAFDVENIILEPCKSKDTVIKKSPELIFKRLNPAKYIVDVKNAEHPFWLVLSENFSLQWSLYQVPSSYFAGTTDKKEKFLSYKKGTVREAPSEATFDLSDASFLLKKPLKIKQYKGNGFSNVWYIDPQKYDLGSNFSVVIFFKPQAVYCLGLIISISVFILAIFILLARKLFNEKSQ